MPGHAGATNGDHLKVQHGPGVAQHMSVMERTLQISTLQSLQTGSWEPMHVTAISCMLQDRVQDCVLPCKQWDQYFTLVPPKCTFPPALPIDLDQQKKVIQRTKHCTSVVPTRPRHACMLNTTHQNSLP